MWEGEGKEKEVKIGRNGEYKEEDLKKWKKKRKRRGVRKIIDENEKA